MTRLVIMLVSAACACCAPRRSRDDGAGRADIPVPTPIHALDVDLDALRSRPTRCRYRPHGVAPAFRTVSLVDGPMRVSAAAVAPRAAQVALVVADASGATSAQARSAHDGTVLWTTPLAGRGALLAYGRDGSRLAVLVEDRARCETCSRIEVLDARTGQRVQSAEIVAIIAPRFATIGLSSPVVFAADGIP